MRTDTIAYIEFFILAGGFLIIFVLTLMLNRRLRIEHPDTYEALGSPSLSLNTSMRSSWLVSRFVWAGHWRRLEDPQLQRLCRLIRYFGIAYLVWLAFVMLDFYLGITWSGDWRQGPGG